MNIEMKYHNRQLKEQKALKERFSIAMLALGAAHVGTAHRNEARTKNRALKGRNLYIALSGLMLRERCRDRALPYPNACTLRSTRDYKAFSLNFNP